MNLRVCHLHLLLLLLVLANGCDSRLSGRTGAQSMQQPTSPPAAVSLVADPITGPSPLVVTVRVDGLPTSGCTNYRFDFGDGRRYATNTPCAVVVTPPPNQPGQSAVFPTATADTSRALPAIPTPPLLQGTPLPRTVAPLDTALVSTGPPLTLVHTYRQPGIYTVRFALIRFDAVTGQEVVVVAANEVLVTVT